MKLRFVLLGLLLLILVGGGAALYFVYTSLDGIVEREIEKQGGEILGTRVEVGSVEISLRTGEGRIRGVRVANPPGFPAGDAFTLAEISLALDVATLTQSPIVLKRISVVSPAVTALANEQGRTNVDAIRLNAERYAGQGASQPASSAGGPEVLLRVDRITSSGGRIAADLTPMGGTLISTELRDLDLRNVGGRTGSEAGEIGSTVAVAFTKEVGIAVARAGTRAGAKALIDKHLEGEAGAAAKELLNRFLK